MKWIKSTERLPQEESVCYIRMINNNGFCVAREVAVLRMGHTGLHWLCEYGADYYNSYSIADFIEWLDESTDPDKAAAIEYLQSEIERIGKFTEDFAQIVAGNLEFVLDILNGKKP